MIFQPGKARKNAFEITAGSGAESRLCPEGENERTYLLKAELPMKLRCKKKTAVFLVNSSGGIHGDAGYNSYKVMEMNEKELGKIAGGAARNRAQIPAVIRVTRG